MGRERLRVIMWPIGAVLAAALASCLPRSTHWPLPCGLGGVIGDAILRLPVVLFHVPLRGGNSVIAGTVLGAAAVLAIGFASGLLWRDVDAEDDEEDEEEPTEQSEDDSDRSWISLGGLMHSFLSLRARLARLFGSRKRRPMPSADGVLRERIEPRFGAAADSDADEERDEEEDEPAPVRKPRPRARRSSGGYVLPALELLNPPSRVGRATMSSEILQENAVALEGVLADFGVRGEIINARPGPVVTLYELEPAPGIKSSRVISLADDIARSMSALSARVAVVSGRNAIGIELPNPTRERVYLRELLASRDYAETSGRLPLCLGKAIGGEAVLVDLARMPHLLIAGTTGSGKSVAINTMILSLVYRLRPDQCRLIMVDPKMLELSVYDGIPHLLTPVVTDPKKAVVALKWAVREMEGRYKKMSKLGVRNIDGYNARLAEAKSKGEKLSRTVHTGYDRESGEAIYENEELDLEPLPYIVVIVDEMADLMMVAGKDIEGAVQRLAQMARAAGLHVILATQRPSVDVITGTIKANFPTRISFQVTSKIDSRTILGEQGAEQLLGQGDMLYMVGGGRISRVHGPFVSDEEVERVVRHLKAQGVPEYLEAVTAEDPQDEDGNPIFDSTAMGAGEGGDLYQQAVAIVTRDRKASTSYIQRRLQIGYNRAASLMERMEEEGIVGQPNHAGKREILVEAADEDAY
jgi:S-DNA-T family DNA segregation ATPase FtsK/SpoIIIE